MDHLREQNVDLNKKVGVLEDTLSQLDQMTKEKDRLNIVVNDLTRQLESTLQSQKQSELQHQHDRGFFI